jgi:hypothetical protein
MLVGCVKHIIVDTTNKLSVIVDTTNKCTSRKLWFNVQGQIFPSYSLRSFIAGRYKGNIRLQVDLNSAPPNIDMSYVDQIQQRLGHTRIKNKKYHIYVQ